VDQATLLQRLHVLYDRGERYRQRLGEIAHGRIPIAEALDNGPARRVGERPEHTIQCTIVKHLPNDEVDRPPAAA
jgi:hypothetical protein